VKRSCAALGVSVAAMLVMAACSPVDQRPAAGAPPSVAIPDLAVGELHSTTDQLPAFSPPTRNPFQFARSGRGDAGTRQAMPSPLPPPEGLPMLPLPLAQPPMRLLGFVTMTDGSKVAVLSIGSDLTMTRVGETLAGRFRVSRIDEDAVELIDAVGERPVRLALP
jgi:hypothetical protein